MEERCLGVIDVPPSLPLGTHGPGTPPPTVDGREPSEDSAPGWEDEDGTSWRDVGCGGNR